MQAFLQFIDRCVRSVSCLFGCGDRADCRSCFSVTKLGLDRPRRRGQNRPPFLLGPTADVPGQHRGREAAASFDRDKTADPSGIKVNVRTRTLHRVCQGNGRCIYAKLSRGEGGVKRRRPPSPWPAEDGGARRQPSPGVRTRTPQPPQAGWGEGGKPGRPRRGLAPAERSGAMQRERSDHHPAKPLPMPPGGTPVTVFTGGCRGHQPPLERRQP